MAVIIGLIITMSMVFGGYSLAGGKFGVMLKALPFEMMMIGGAAVGSFLVSNKGTVVKKTLKDFKKLFSGPQYKKQDYIDLLCLLYILLSTVKQKGMLTLESHIEDPHSSDIFGQFPKIQNDHHITEFIADTLRVVSMNMEDPYQVEDSMEKQLEKHHHEAAAPAHALQTAADGIPALGIVAAVLGVIKTMSSIAEPPEILGLMIGGALVGTFLGVFLGYTMIGPFAQRLQGVYDEEHHMYTIIRDVLVNHLHKNPPQVAVEVGRGGVPTHLQPSFAELEEAMDAAKG